VINLTDDAVAHKGSRTALTQNDTTLYAKLSPEQHVSKDTPPVFIVQGTNDRTVPVMNSVLFYEACIRNQVPAELHLFENGAHGFGLGRGSGRGPGESSLVLWPDLLIKWMDYHKLLAPAAR
jgi:dipeptidyl aminopeptidase/acylaminoacyl peptidase